MYTNKFDKLREDCYNATRRITSYLSCNRFSILVLYFIIIGIWTLPWPLYMPRSGLDPSWLIGINMAFFNNLQFGPDIAFTFGPLGFLYTPTYTDPTLWSISFVFTLFVHFLFIFSFVLLMIKSSATWKEYIVVLPVLLIPIHFIRDYELLLITVVFLYLIVTHKLNQKYEMYILYSVSILLAIASLIKFTMVIASMSIIAAFLLICLFNKQFEKCIYIIIIYIIFLITLWLMAGQYLINLPIYLFNSYQLSSGYNDAMAISGPEWQIYMGIFGAVFIIFLFIYSFIKRNNTLFIFIFLSIGLLFLVFKHGFVRQDGHVYAFFATYSVILIYIFIIAKNHTGFILRMFSLLLSVLFIVSIYNGFPGIMEDNISQKLPTYASSFSLISNKTYQTQLLENAKNNIKYDYPLDNKTIQYLNNKTLDIFPWDIALVWAYDFNWSPRPVFQSYSAYSSQLDKLNAQHFSKENAPQTILYAYKSIDWRYPIFDEPATFASILHNYTFVNKSDEFILLSYLPKNTTIIIEEDLGTVEVEIGKLIKIPRYDSGYVNAHIELEYSTFGKFMKFLYKPVPAHIRFKFSDSSYSNEFRFISGVSMNGVFLSQYVGNVDDLASVFSGNITQDITEMVIEVDNPIYYKKYIKIKFIGVPANISIQKGSYIMPDWHMLKRIQGGIMAIDSVGKRLYAQESRIVSLSKATEQFINLNGWAADDLTKDGEVKTFLVFRGDSEEIVIPTKKTHRPDVASYFGVNSYEQSGWSAILRLKEFEEKCYDISLRILRANGEEYFELAGDKPICFI